MSKPSHHGPDRSQKPSDQASPSVGPGYPVAGMDPTQLKRDVQAFVRVFRQEMTNVREGIINQDNHQAIDALNYMDEMVDFLDNQTRG